MFIDNILSINIFFLNIYIFVAQVYIRGGLLQISMVTRFHFDLELVGDNLIPQNTVATFHVVTQGLASVTVTKTANKNYPSKTST